MNGLSQKHIPLPFKVKVGTRKKTPKETNAIKPTMKG